jgi:eukaryotic-like serine/threonine-protein kinase
MNTRRSSTFVRTLARSRLPQVLGGYLAIGFGVLQVVDMFVERLGLPDWAFLGMLGLLIIGVPVIVATAIAQQRARSGTGSVETASSARAATPVRGASPPAAPVKSAPPPAASATATGAHRWLTWRNALAGGAGSIGALVLVVAVFMGMRTLGIGPAASLVAAGVLDRSERILIADFQSQTRDTLLAGAVTEAFRIDFEQSRIVQVVESGAVRDALLRMQRPADAPLNPGLALELAEREGIKAVLTGEINTAGRTFVVSARLLSTDGNVLVSLRETARDSAAIIAAIDRLSSRMRERIGESLRTIRSGEPLQQVTTSSLAALRKYSQAVRALDTERDPEKGIPLLEEATALDTMFAMAYRKLGVALSNHGEPRGRWAPAYTRAFELSGRLPDRERYLAQAAYYRYVLNDEDRAIAAYRMLLDLYPSETAALNNLALLYADRGDAEAAVELYEQAIAADSSSSLYYSNLVFQLAALGREADALAAIEMYERRLPDNQQTTLLRGAFAAMLGQYDSAAMYFRQVSENPRASGTLRATGDTGLGALALLAGNVAAGRRHYDRALNSPLLAAQPLAGIQRTGLDIRIRLIILADTAGALRLAEEALRGVSLVELDPTGGLLLEVARFYSVAGVPARARALLAEYDRLPLDEGVRRGLREGRQWNDAVLSIAEGHHERGLAELRRLAERPRCVPCMHLELAGAFEAAAAADSAIAHYEQYLSASWLMRHELDGFDLPRAHERLGQLYDAAGDTQRALFHLARFTELWQDADPELRPRVEAARGRISALSRRAG